MNDENNVNINGVIENINTRTNVYTPIIEAIVNSIDAINTSGRKDGEITVTIKRDNQATLNLDDSGLQNITSIEIFDNGVGFNEDNTKSFGTLYSDFKKDSGGKGFGRFMFLKYFKNVHVESIYEDENSYIRRIFDFGQDNKMVANQKSSPNKVFNDTQTTVFLNNIKSTTLDKKIDTVSRKLLEKLLIYFIDDTYNCPKITVQEGEDKKIVLNDLLKSDYPEISQIEKKEFVLGDGNSSERFKIKIFKIYYPDSQKSKISLVAHRREVTETPIYYYVPEFEENFYDEIDETDSTKDFMIKTYVMGNYLDKNVSLERSTFNFHKKGSDSFYPYSQEDIEKEASNISRDLNIFKDVIKSRVQKKKDRITEYIDAKAPWYKSFLPDLDISNIPYNLTDEIIDVELHKVRLQQEVLAKTQIETLLNSPTKDLVENVQELVKKISRENTSQLVHYVALRKYILQLFKKSLEIKDDGKYESESAVHNIIFPTKSDSDKTRYADHNLWIIDEKLNFTEYISSDQPIDKGVSERTDLLIYNRKIALRGSNESSNPITIFEFKKPQRDDFVNRSSEEDPIDQIIRYAVDIMDGKYRTPQGRNIEVADNTPFYGYLVCDLTEKVHTWLYKQKNFKKLPDGKGYFNWYENNNLYIEVISWDKMLNDAEMRNKIFFNKLGIE